MFFERLTLDRQNSLKNYAIIEIRIKIGEKQYLKPINGETITHNSF